MFLKIVFISFLISSYLFPKTSLQYGLGITYLSSPLYIGSKVQKNYILPFPYISFKSKYLNVKKNKISMNIYRYKGHKLELSISGQNSVKSNGSLREGMEDLDAILEIGPKYTYNIFDRSNDELNLELPIRMALTVGDELFNHKGFITNLNLKYTRTIFYDFKFTYTTGFTYNSERISRYYYDVNLNNMNDNRAQFKTSGGYAGFHNSIAFTKRVKNYWFGYFLRFYNLDNVSFKESPLFEKKSALYSAIGISYIF